MNRYVIIGSGVTGVSAVEAIRAEDPSGQISLVSDDPHGYYSRPGMAYLLTGEQNDHYLFPFPEKHFQTLQVRRLRDRAIQIDPFQHIVTLRSKKILVYDRLLIATGSTAAPLTIPGSDLEGVVKLDNLEDARRIIKLARKGRSAGVVGGGVTALELVEGLLPRGCTSTYFCTADAIGTACWMRLNPGLLRNA
jgi:NAD(P)H-nitrite reductase large subunit